MAAFVQDASNGTALGTSVAVAFGSNVTAGNLITVVVRANTNDAPSWTVTDSLGNTYVEDEAQFQSTDLTTTRIYRASNISGGANTVTFAGTNNIRRGIVIKEFSGLDTTSPLDVTNSNQGTDASVECGSVTMTADGVIVIGWGYSGAQTTTIDTDYANLEQNTTGRLGSCNRVTTAITDECINTASASNNWTACTVTYKNASAGGAFTKMVGDNFRLAGSGGLAA